MAVHKKVLDNGLTILVHPRHATPKVSTQLWYHVGSKDEKSGQKGIAHFIEHMIFKGTDKLSECDIDLITHKLSGYGNAFTSNDYTGYLFDFPTQHWHEALPIMADCMRNSSFKQDHLNSELKAVIQELKMRKDDHVGKLIEDLFSSLFADHPYHYPIIGYKQDLWNLDRNEMIAFYRQHYVPNNATLVVVGDVDVEDVYQRAQKAFGDIQPSWNYQREQFHHGFDLSNVNITIYREIQQPSVLFCWTVPGSSAKDDYLAEMTSWILGSSRGSRLYRKLVDELDLAIDVDAFNYDLFDYGVFFLYIEPKDMAKLDQIKEIIQHELRDITRNGVTEKELQRATKKIEVDYLSVMQNNQKQAYEIAKYYLATGDENYFHNYTQYPQEKLAQKLQAYISRYIRPDLMNMGSVLPLAQESKALWVELQEQSDIEDARILHKKERASEIEGGKCASDIVVKFPAPFNYPKSQESYIQNGMKLLSTTNPEFPKVDLILDFKAKSYYEPVEKLGISSFLAMMLEEGTKNYSAIEFADMLESYGMSLQSSAGGITLSMLSSDLSKGLELVDEMLTRATLDVEGIERVRDQLLVEHSQFWDEPSKFVVQLIKNEIYKNHPYAKSPYGTKESLKSITQKDLQDYYHAYISCKGSRAAIVGDFMAHDIHKEFEQYFKDFGGLEVKGIEFPEIQPVTYKEINYPIMRDQTVLCYGGLSVSRLDSDYDKLLIFDQIFAGGVLGSMSSRLFNIRQQTGLFYTIGGTLTYNADRQPGLVLIKTIVSNDRLHEAERAIEEVINTAIETVSQDEFIEAKQAIINSMVDNFSSNFKIASAALFVDYYGFGSDYFDKRADQLKAITLEEMQASVRKYLHTSKMIKARVGRV